MPLPKDSDATEVYRKLLKHLANDPDVLIETAYSDEGIISATSHYGTVRINVEISEIPQ